MARVVEGSAEVAVGDGVVGVQGDGRPAGGGGPIELPHPPVKLAQVGVVVGHVGRAAMARPIRSIAAAMRPDWPARTPRRCSASGMIRPLREDLAVDALRLRQPPGLVVLHGGLHRSIERWLRRPFGLFEPSPASTRRHYRAAAGLA